VRKDDEQAREDFRNENQPQEGVPTFAGAGEERDRGIRSSNSEYANGRQIGVEVVVDQQDTAPAARPQVYSLPLSLHDHVQDRHQVTGNEEAVHTRALAYVGGQTTVTGQPTVTGHTTVTGMFNGVPRNHNEGHMHAQAPYHAIRIGEICNGSSAGEDAQRQTAHALVEIIQNLEPHADIVHVLGAFDNNDSANRPPHLHIHASTSPVMQTSVVAYPHGREASTSLRDARYQGEKLFLCVYLCTYVCMYMCVCWYMCVCVHVYSFLCMHAEKYDCVPAYRGSTILLRGVKDAVYFQILCVCMYVCM
jgi:hypothetical protein